MRLFVALPVRDPWLADVAASLPAGVRPTADGQWHVTLRFLGDADPAEVRAALDRSVWPNQVHGVFSGRGAFPDPCAARVLWVGVEAAGVAGLAALVHEATQHLGRRPEARPFVPHVTLGRAPRPMDVSSWVGMSDIPVRPLSLDEVVLFASRLGPDGPVHSRVHTWRLGCGKRAG